MTLEMKEAGKSLEEVLKNLKILLSKVEKEKDDQLAAVKLC